MQEQEKDPGQKILKIQTELCTTAKTKSKKKLMEHIKKHFSKAKYSKVHEDEIHENLTNENTRHKTLSGDSNREGCYEDDARKFLCLVKRRATTQIGNAKEVTDE